MRAYRKQILTLTKNTFQTGIHRALHKDSTIASILSLANVLTLAPFYPPGNAKSQPEMIAFTAKVLLSKKVCSIQLMNFIGRGKFLGEEYLVKYLVKGNKHASLMEKRQHKCPL